MALTFTNVKTTGPLQAKTYTKWKNAPTSIEYIIVAGGGSGGNQEGGGGGAGGLIANTYSSLLLDTTYAISVGAGGAATVTSSTSTAGTVGEDSTFLGLTAYGGGGGSNPAVGAAGTGGSGGGGSVGTTPGSPRSNQGYAGGTGYVGSGYGAGGGGGAGGAGLNGNALYGGAGGIGYVTNFYGNTTYLAGGGGGGTYDGAGTTYGGPGGLGGGGAGGGTTTSGVAVSGTENTGGGGGGGMNQGGTYNASGAGGKGVVLLRYPSTYANAITSGASVMFANGYTVYTFNQSGTIKFLPEYPKYSTTITDSSYTNFDSNIANVSLLINGNESTANTYVTDVSTSNTEIQVFGSVAASDFSPYSTGYYSTKFSSQSYITTPASTAFDITGGDFTVEFWVYFTAYNTMSYSGSNAVGNFQNTNGWLAGFNGISDLTNATFVTFSGGSIATAIYASGITSTNLPLNTWHHVAFVQSGANFYFFLDGVSYNATTAPAGVGAGGQLALGVYQQNLTYSGNPNMNISNLRIVKGTALYTSNFTVPTTPLTAISGTSFLACQDNRHIDNGPLTKTLTTSTTIPIQQNSPFFNTSISANYGSGYFSGSPNHLKFPTITDLALSGDFTIEMWVYPTAWTSSSTALISGATSSGSIQFGRYGTTSNFGIANQGVTWIVSDATLPTVNMWTHVAVTKAGSSVKVWVNGSQSGSTGTSASGFNAINGIGGVAYDSTSIFEGYISDVRVLNGTALYTTTFPVPTAPLSRVTNTKLLTLQYRYPVNNHTFRDESNFKNQITRYGNASQGSFTPYGDSWSTYLPATGSYLTGSNGNFNISATTAVWTVEFWVYPISAGAIFAIGSGGAYGNSLFIGWGYGTANKFRVGGGNGSGSNPIDFNANGTYYGNKWYHIAVTRTSAGVYTIYIDGASDGTATYNAGTLATGTTFIINGVYDNNGLANNGGTFYISNLRFTSGTVLYNGNFTPSTAPLKETSSTILLTCQSNRFIDNSSLNNAITVGGSTTVQKFSPLLNYKQTPTTYSNYFDGSGDYITTPANTANLIYFPAGTDFTFEIWVYPTATQQYTDIFGAYTGATTGRWLLYTDTDGLTPILYQYPSLNGTFSGAMTLNAWNHIAIVRIGSTTTGYINGVSRFSTATSYTLDGGTTNLFIGTGYTGRTMFKGYLSNFRVVKGLGVYTGAFTTPTGPLTATQSAGTNISAITSSTQTVLLACQSSTIVDNSSYNYALTGVGDTKPKAFNPFGYTNTRLPNYQANTYGGSAYFDGSGDYLSIPASGVSDFGTGDFTIEMWINPKSLSTYNMLYAGGGYLCLVWGATASVFGLNANNGVQDVTSTASVTPINQWTHIAFVRSSGTLYFYINGVASGSGGFSSAFGSSSGTVSIAYNPVYSGSYYTNAGISNLRVVKGTAVYTSNFVPPTSPLVPVGTTSLLLNMTNAAIYDTTMVTNIETVGDTKLSKAVTKFGYSSMYFDGTGDYLTIPTNANFSFGTGDFTIEGWVYLSSAAGAYRTIVCIPHASGSLIVRFGNSSDYSSYFQVSILTTSATNVYSTNQTQTALLNQWVHFAFTRSSSTCRVFLNGTLQNIGTGAPATSFGTNTFSDSTSITNNAAVGIGEQIGASVPFIGYIDDLRITKGQARYTANFTAPTKEMVDDSSYTNFTSTTTLINY